jgi:hypothetical protein
MLGIGNYSSYGSIFGSSNSASNSLFSSFYSNLGQYASVKSGAYAKATRAYYGKNTVDTSKINSKDNVSSKNKVSSNDSTDSSSKTSTSSSASSTSAYSKTNKDKVAINTVKTEASELNQAAKKLLDTGKDSVFAKDKEYNKDDAYKAVNDFVKEYNDTVTALGNTKNTSVSNAGDSMKRMSRIMNKDLEAVGISIGNDGKLSIDETKFKAADADKVKSVFNGGSGSFAGMVSSSSARIGQEASNQISKLNDNENSKSTYNNSSYTNKGAYNNYNNSGWLYEGFF